MIGIYIYPLVIFLFHRLFNKNKKQLYITSQTKRNYLHPLLYH